MRTDTDACLPNLALLCEGHCNNCYLLYCLYMYIHRDTRMCMCVCVSNFTLWVGSGSCCTYIPGAAWSHSGQPIPRVEYTEEEVKTWWVWNTYMRSVLGMEWPLGTVQVLPFWCLVLYSLAILLLLRCKWCCVALWLVANACMLAPTEERGRQMLPPPTLNCVCMYVYAITNTTEHTQVVTAQS